jgi:hypothetical protein
MLFQPDYRYMLDVLQKPRITRWRAERGEASRVHARVGRSQKTGLITGFGGTPRSYGRGCASA